MSQYTDLRVMMVDTQVRPSDVTKFPIIEAMLTVPREEFVPPALRAAAYVGGSVDLGHGREVLEARSLAKLLDALDIQPAESVLDVGTGLGYGAAVMARLAASVVALEEDADLAEGAKAALAGIGNVAVVAGPLAAGHAAQGPYDVITVQGGVEQIPVALLAQLKEGGRIGAVFMEGALGTVKVGLKTEGKISWRFAFNATAPVLPGFAAARAFVL
ncbi:MAG: protein-L-isoaspartate O-methyltransferase [Rhodobacterales bacterium RIFCSPHIGHO2_02_FULL_62_130]|nr:MAG: protein-L-isoaspartate O-methyltransferase [Rhodobacterales bacterium RIFCSPHIGHO2_02_FULL_62_130]OHC60498.1 MAG: protein-L-isoaspartate O-methyltransferase [Rhodobacterales bacterium RIFCSPHIGHO2_12_FULL_62_75]